MPEANFNDLGECEGTPLEITWPFHRHIVPLLPWILLVALLFLKPNRDRRAWVILLPFVLGWAWAALRSSPYGIFGTAFSWLWLGLGVFLLLGFLFEGKRPRQVLAAACLIILASGLLALACAVDFDFSPDTIDYYGQVAIAFVALSFVTVAALIGAKHRCSLEYTQSIFTRGFIMGAAVGSVLLVAFSLVSKLVGAFATGDGDPVAFALSTSLVSPLVTLLGILLGTLPMRWVATRSTFYEQRLMGLLGLRYPSFPAPPELPPQPREDAAE